MSQMVTRKKVNGRIGGIGLINTFLCQNNNVTRFWAVAFFPEPTPA